MKEFENDQEKLTFMFPPNNYSPVYSAIISDIL